jgi:hypothetical protein
MLQVKSWMQVRHGVKQLWSIVPQIVATQLSSKWCSMAMIHTLDSRKGEVTCYNIDTVSCNVGGLISVNAGGTEWIGLDQIPSQWLVLPELRSKANHGQSHAEIWCGHPYTGASFPLALVTLSLVVSI